MPFIYVTGPAGSGKTAAFEELRSKGADAHDEDEPEIGSAYNKQTEQAVQIPQADERNPEWFNRHEWRIRPNALDDFKSRSKSSLIILCGNSLKHDEIQQLFDKVVYLRIDEDTLRKRIAGRQDNDYGKNAHELQSIIERYRLMDETYNSSNSIVIDATQPIEKVASDILSAV